MKKALILHGRDGDSENNWFPWIKKELEFQDYEVDIPNLPNTEKPVLEEQLLSLKSDNKTLFIGHSLGCQLALHYAIKNNITNATIILVAPTYPKLGEELGENLFGDVYETISKYYDTPIDFEKLIGNKIIIFLSDNDPYINMESVEKYYSDLENKEFVYFEGKGHFNNSAGVFELEEILKYV